MQFSRYARRGSPRGPHAEGPAGARPVRSLKAEQHGAGPRCPTRHEPHDLCVVRVDGVLRARSSTFVLGLRSPGAAGGARRNLAGSGALAVVGATASLERR